MVTILGIESSCDDTAVAVMRDGKLLSNEVNTQRVHELYGGVVPELASRAHQQNIIPVLDIALKNAGVTLNDITAIAYTRGPGLMGSLLVGSSFAKGLSTALQVPIVEVNHLHAHILAHFIQEPEKTKTVPSYPFLCLLVSGGNSQIILVKKYNEMEILGRTIDDAAGEAFDKCAKIMNLPYPGGPHIDKLSKEGNAEKFTFNKPQMQGYDYSFSGLKTSFLYFLIDNLKCNPNFIEENKEDLCASIQKTIVDVLMAKVIKAAKDLKIKDITLAGGVSANTELRSRFMEMEKKGYNVFIPKFNYTTDNAAMICMAGYFKYIDNDISTLDLAPYARVQI